MRHVAPVTDSSMSINVVIDTDPGIDDVVALTLALRSPELDVVALTTTYGNATLAATTRNARHLLQLLGRTDVPLTAGAERPLSRPAVTAPETHGPTGVGYAAVPAEREAPGDPLALLHVLAAQPAAVTLVTLGPLTNLARALQHDAVLVRRRVARHIGMFGNLRERGNTNRWADFNAWCDPEALDVVLKARLPSAMVGLDVTRKMTVSSADVARYRRAPDPLVKWLAAALEYYVEFHRRQERLDGCVINDVLPVAELIHPGVLRFEPTPLTVVQDDGQHRGRTRVDEAGVVTPVAIGVDLALMHRLLGRALGTQ